jgi:hypothetical protein
MAQNCETTSSRSAGFMVLFEAELSQASKLPVQMGERELGKMRLSR